MVMLIILIIGAATLLVSALNSSSIQIERDKVTADALAKAKEALIGRAVTDANRPGSLPCPDSNNDGSADLLSGNDCPSYIGRLPWKTLGISDLRDGSGERLWYGLSRNFRDDNSNPINSDNAGTLNISGTTVASGIVAIVFAPGVALSGQSRSATTMINCVSNPNGNVPESNCSTSYLEPSGNAVQVNSTPSNSALSTAATTHVNYLAGMPSSTFNDQAIYITHDQLFAPVEMRIAREAKKCLDDYALTVAGKYPWAAPIIDTTTYNSTINTYFGRIPASPTPNAQTLSTALTSLQAAINAFNANPISSNKTALINVSNYVISIKNLIPAISNQVDNAGDSGVTYANSPTVSNYSNAIAGLNTAISALSPYLWAANCFVAGTYWDYWKNMVFYQVAQGFEPGSAGTSCGANCLTINGSGNTAQGNGSYRAAVVVARRGIGAQMPHTTTSDSSYLEANAQGSNQHVTAPSNTFITYSLSDTTNFLTVNDLVLCLDGNINCK